MQHKQSVTLITLLVLICLLGSMSRETLARILDWAWDIQLVDADGGHAPSLAFDSAGYPHIAVHGGGGIRYERKGASGWLPVEMVESGFYEDPALVLGSNDYPHISYQEMSLGTGTGESLKYAYKDATGWHFEYVDLRDSSIGDMGLNSEIALDTDGYSRIAYLYDDYDFGSEMELRYAYKDATGWHPAVLYSFGLAGWGISQYGSVSLDIDSDGYAHIVTYRGADNTDMVHVYQDASGWHLEQVADCGKSSHMRLDQNDYPHVVYRNCSSALSYAYKDGDGWHDEAVALGNGPSLYLDDNDNPYIACRGENSKHLELIVPAGDTWVKSLVTETVAQIASISIAIEDDDAVHIAYAIYDGSYHRDLYYAYGEPVLGPCSSELAIATFDDQDANGAQDPGEPYISWPYTLTVNAVDQVIQSPSGGWYTTTLTEDDTWTVTTYTDANWMPTTPTSLNSVAACLDQQALFGVWWKEHVYLPLVVK